MRLFPDEKEGESWGWKRSVVDAGYEVLCGESQFMNVGLYMLTTKLGAVSQFTLMANLKKGSKPDFHGAMVSLLLPLSLSPV